jgi:hypothetical protein
MNSPGRQPMTPDKEGREEIMVHLNFLLCFSDLVLLGFV